MSVEPIEFHRNERGGQERRERIMIYAILACALFWVGVTVAAIEVSSALISLTGGL